MGVEVPPSFPKLIENHDTNFKQLNHNNCEVFQLITASNQTILDIPALTNSKVDTFLAQHKLEDIYEIKISSIPADVYSHNLTKNAIANAIPKALDLNQQLACVR